MNMPIYNQKGLSLIELMIGILLGSLLIIVMLYILAGSRTSSQLIEAESRMQDNIQYAFEVLNSTIRQAGYVTNPTDDFTTIIVNVDGIDNAGDIIIGTEGGDATTPDTITVYYQGNADGRVANCLGAPIDPALVGISQNTFSITPDGSLQCEAATYDSVIGSTNLDPQPLIGGGNTTDGVDSRVTNLQILYGLDTDDSGSVNQYSNMDQITTFEDRNRIIAVSIAITLEEQVGADTLSRTFTSGIYLRNRI